MWRESFEIIFSFTLYIFFICRMYKHFCLLKKYVGVVYFIRIFCFGFFFCYFVIEESFWIYTKHIYRLKIGRMKKEDSTDEINFCKNERKKKTVKKTKKSKAQKKCNWNKIAFEDFPYFFFNGFLNAFAKDKNVIDDIQWYSTFLHVSFFTFK